MINRPRIKETIMLTSGPFVVEHVTPLDSRGVIVDLPDNAALLGAAPDLLAIARRVAEHFEDTDAPLGIDARAAIAKALGTR